MLKHLRKYIEQEMITSQLFSLQLFFLSILLQSHWKKIRWQKYAVSFQFVYWIIFYSNLFTLIKKCSTILQTAAAIFVIYAFGKGWIGHLCFTVHFVLIACAWNGGRWLTVLIWILARWWSFAHWKWRDYL